MKNAGKSCKTCCKITKTMINGHDLYTILAGVLPLYVPMTLAYISVRWWKLILPEQCAGINRFVAVFAIPFLYFHFISKNDPYAMNHKFIAADTLQKIIVLVPLILWTNFTKWGSLDWLITNFSLSTLPYNLVIGIPILVAMYGEYTRSLMVQIVVLQYIIWGTLLLFLFEYRAARIMIMERFPDTAGAIASVKIDSDVFSLDGSDCFETDTINEGEGKLHVTLRKSNCSMSRRPSGFSVAEVYSINTTPRASDVSENWDTRRLSRSELTKSRRSDAEVRLSISEARVNPDAQNGHSGLHKVGTTGSATRLSGTGKQMPPAGVMANLMLIMVWRKLIRNPNTYSSLIGLMWSLVHFRWKIEMPIIVEKSIIILSNTGLGMAMFTLGLSMALQKSLIPCGKAQATYAMVARFIVGPAVMAAASLIVGIRSELLHVAIVQAALPQAVVPFIFAREYNVHPEILSTSVIFGMVIAIPVTLIFYILLGL